MRKHFNTAKTLPVKTASEDSADNNPHCRIYSTDIDNGTHFDVYLSGEIVSPDAYADLLNVLFGASVHDVVHLKINSPGGDLDTGLQIQDAIESSEATVIGYLSGSADSAASGIFCSCDDHVVGDLALMLVHTVSLGFFAPIQDFLERAEVIYEQNLRWLNKTYKGFCTASEIEDIVLNKRQMILTSTDIIDRLDRMKTEKITDEDNATPLTVDLVSLCSDIAYIKQWIAKQNTEV